MFYRRGSIALPSAVVNGMRSTGKLRVLATLFVSHQFNVARLIHIRSSNFFTSVELVFLLHVGLVQPFQHPTAVVWSAIPAAAPAAQGLPSRALNSSGWATST